MDINDSCAVGALKNACKYPEKYMIKSPFTAFSTSLCLLFTFHEMSGLLPEIIFSMVDLLVSVPTPTLFEKQIITSYELKESLLRRKI